MTTHVTLATRTASPLRELTERRRGLVVDAYPLERLLLLRCFGEVDGVENDPELRNSGRALLYHAGAGDEGTFLLEGGNEGDAIASLAAENVHVLPPIRWERGEARLTLVLEDGADAQSLFDRFPDARLLAKRRAIHKRGSDLSSPLFLAKLTEKQARALLAAYGAGYYEFPRRATTEEVSLSLGIARSTFEQHLNRAEHHVVRAMLPLVRMRAGRSHGEALEVYSRFSRELGLYVRLELLGDRVSGVRFARRPPAHTAGPDHPYLARIIEHIRTGRGDLRDIPLHLEVGPFERDVLAFLRTIPPGKTMTYGEIARAAWGEPSRRDRVCAKSRRDRRAVSSGRPEIRGRGQLLERRRS